MKITGDLTSRRQMMRSLAGSAVGGSLLLPGILSELLAIDAPAGVADPLAPRAPHFRARAERVIFLFMSGGVSHLDSFDPKPRLAADHGKMISYRGEGKDMPLIRPQWEFKSRGKCGMEI